MLISGLAATIARASCPLSMHTLQSLASWAQSVLINCMTQIWHFLWLLGDCLAGSRTNSSFQVYLPCYSQSPLTLAAGTYSRLRERWQRLVQSLLHTIRHGRGLRRRTWGCKRRMQPAAPGTNMVPHSDTVCNNIANNFKGGCHTSKQFNHVTLYYAPVG